MKSENSLMNYLFEFTIFILNKLDYFKVRILVKSSTNFHIIIIAQNSDYTPILLIGILQTFRNFLNGPSNLSCLFKFATILFTNLLDNFHIFFHKNKEIMKNF